MPEPDRKRRVRGSGAIFQRGLDGMWVGRAELRDGTGKRKVFYGLTREVVEDKMTAWLGDMALVDGPDGYVEW